MLQRKNTKIKSCTEIAIDPLNTKPADAANTPDNATAGTISICLKVLIKITTAVNATGITKAKALPRALPPEILVPIII